MDEPPISTSPEGESLLRQADEYTRREPRTALASAFGFGLLLTLLPVRALLGALLTIILPLLKPALLVLGFLKACELCQNREQTDLRS